jgi:hypothetical protein
MTGLKDARSNTNKGFVVHLIGVSGVRNRPAAGAFLMEYVHLSDSFTVRGENAIPAYYASTIGTVPIVREHNHGTPSARTPSSPYQTATRPEWRERRRIWARRAVPNLLVKATEVVLGLQ